MASFSAIMWATIKTALASGEYSGIKELHAKLQKKYKKFPSIAAITKHADSEGWKKAADKPAIEKSIQEKNIEILARAGATRDTAAHAVADLMSATKRVIVNYDNPKTKAEANGEPQGFVEEVPDMIAKDKGLAHFYKLTGDYAAEKIESVTPETLKRFVTGVAVIVANYVDDNNRLNCLNEISALMLKIDNGEIN
jgi:hypothetical protein